MSTHQNQWRREVVLKAIYEMSAQDTRRDVDFEELKSRVFEVFKSDDDVEGSLVRTLNFFREEGFVVVPQSDYRGKPYSMYITSKGILEGEQLEIASDGLSSIVTMDEIEVFISHSSQDLTLVESIIGLLRSGLNLSSRSIRATSVDGYRLPSGLSIEEQLRQEIHASKALVAILSPKSINSTFVLFELGARWGIKKPIMLLLTKGLDAGSLPAPLSATNALRADNRSQLHQFIEDLGSHLQRSVDRPAAYETRIEEILQAQSRS